MKHKKMNTETDSVRERDRQKNGAKIKNEKLIIQKEQKTENENYKTHLREGEIFEQEDTT